MRDIIKRGNITGLQLILTVVMVSLYLISNTMTSKLIDFPMGLTMNTAVFVFPFVYILSDLFSEVYGYKWSRFTCYLALTMNIVMVIVFSLSIKAAPSIHWNNQAAYESVLGGTPRIVFASLTAFVLGDLMNDKVFARMKRKHATSIKGFESRAILSSLAGELVDCFVFLPIAFIGQLPLNELAKMVVAQVFIKTAFEVVFMPVTKYIVKKVDDKEKRDAAIKLSPK